MLHFIISISQTHTKDGCSISGNMFVNVYYERNMVLYISIKDDRGRVEPISQCIYSSYAKKIIFFIPSNQSILIGSSQ